MYLQGACGVGGQVGNAEAAGWCAVKMARAGLLPNKVAVDVIHYTGAEFRSSLIVASEKP